MIGANTAHCRILSTTNVHATLNSRTFNDFFLLVVLIQGPLDFWQNFRTFPWLSRITFCSRTFQNFQGPWELCVLNFGCVSCWLTSWTSQMAVSYPLYYLRLLTLLLLKTLSYLTLIWSEFWRPLGLKGTILIKLESFGIWLSLNQVLGTWYSPNGRPIWIWIVRWSQHQQLAEADCSSHWQPVHWMPLTY